jgi:hypothetical protein
MFRRKVESPDGRTWTIGRRWLPRRRRIGRAKLPDIGDAGGLDIGGADDLGFIGAILAVVVVAVVSVVVVLVLFNVVAIAIELLLVVLVLVGGVLSRVVFRRPWIVHARSDEATLEWPVVGYLPSRRKIADVARRLASGDELDAARRDG